MTGDTTAQIDVLRDELKTLKDEQRDRIRSRDGLVYSVVAAIVAAVGGARVAGDAVALLLPPIVLALGWTYLANDRAISAIGQYLRTDLGPRLTELTGAEMLRWESVHRSDDRRRQRKAIQLGVDLAAFVMPALAAVVWYMACGEPRPVLVLAGVAEAAVAVLTAWQFAVYAETGKAR